MNDYDFERFVDEFEYAYENVPFYKKHLAKSGLLPSDIASIYDVKRIPPTEKKDYRKNFPIGVVAKGYTLSDESLTKSQSSGTSGERLITYEVGMLLLDRAVACTAIREEVEEAFTRVPRKICRYAAPNCSDVECANPNSSAEDRMLSDGTLVLPVYHDLLTTSDKLIDRALEEICHYQPDLYYVDPTHFAFLVREARKRGICLPDAPIVATYTSSTPLNRRQIKEAFHSFGHTQVVFSELVSSSEMGWLALECEQGHLHLNTDSYFMELLKDGLDVNIGDTGELFITSLDNGAIPHIRYKTGDTFKYLGADCECGLEGDIVRWAGRVTDQLVLKDGARISPAEVNLAVGAPNWLDLYQLTQQKADEFELLLMVNEAYAESDEQQLICRLNRVLGRDSQISVKKVSYISTERSGKFQCVKSNLNK
ncbi:phenylacetate--CoA ligase family protein [Thalassomonas viridans]|uniref:Phenylacetate--CoA ligase family protein n=1 Tax=Thalassomonas viridans TaxID=137584 RepID=A0AAE9ZBX1_9GAMM|nr:phenylacetate--CoA ligase family protein [Thalassomonas viridans]WDE09184.1 phenylacetate--CoA ligase family protein [Thalassomonas viridans]